MKSRSKDLAILPFLLLLTLVMILPMGAIYWLDCRASKKAADER